MPCLRILRRLGLAIALLGAMPGGVALGQVEVASPDGSVMAKVAVADGRLTIAVDRNGQAVLEPSPAGVILEGVDIGQGVRLGRSATYSIDEAYAWVGNVSTIRNHANGMRVPVHHRRGNWVLEVRAYDDGVAWRYQVPGGRERRISGEASGFVLPEGSRFWSHQNTKDYEAQYRRYDAADASLSGAFTMPLTVELPQGGYACLAESDVMHYSGMTLDVAGPGRFQAAFLDDPEGWTMRGAFASPWRICIAVDDLNQLVNSTITFNVAPPPDARLFPDGARTAWIRPGRALWQWWFYGWDGMNWDRQREFVDTAAAINAQYYLVDDGWEDRRRGWITEDRTKWDSLQELVRYARTKDVEIWVWRHWRRLQTREEREAFFGRLSRIGVVGVKIDFMESESQERLAFYRDALESAARHRLMVNFHGSNKSAGEIRTWPNEMTRESVFGLEQNKGGPVITLEHYTAMPFTAFITGPKDFTPTTFRRGNTGSTQAFQLATAVIHTSPFLCWAGPASEFVEHPSIELIRHVPAAWDETLVLPGSEIGRFVAFARRSGDEWWVAVLRGDREPGTYDLDLSFLGDGRWRVLAATDVMGDYPRLQMRSSEVASGDSLIIELESAGGYVARITSLKDE